MFEEEIDLPPERNDWLGYTKGATCLEKQYNNSVIPGTEFKVDGFRTLSENMADVEGVKQSFMAYKSYQKEKGYIEEGRLLTTEDITADQLFFLGWGIILCEKYGEEELENAILVDNHAPSVLRVNNVVSNIEEFADAFRCSPGSPMNPENRCSVF
ncbi:peptidase family M13 [Necator americanus]|uniref:Peptidase family M13 n=1 Tax=Necator americanus TaxID=51031 RepID=W2TJU6_NECAM|nr:peptidase family M13 [Necator americanus]ETN81252.1 peptidase family M13 [Necator americanus]